MNIESNRSFKLEQNCRTNLPLNRDALLTRKMYFCMMKSKFTRIHLELFFLVKQFLKYRERFVSEGDINAMKRMNDACDKLQSCVEEAELLTEGI